MDAIPFEFISVKEAKEVLDTPNIWNDPEEKPKVKSWDRERQPRLPQDLKLSQGSIEWLTKLPREIRPMMLAVKFPHVVNKLCEVWPRPAACETYLDSLLINQRKDRQGFPLKVLQELSAVKAYKDKELELALSKLEATGKALVKR